MKTTQGKKWYTSRLIWEGVIGVGVAVCGAVAEGMSWPLATLAGFGALTILLRALTTEGLLK